VVYLKILITLLFCFLVYGCQSSKKKSIGNKDQVNSNTIIISADESFKPIIDQQVQVFESNNYGSKINVYYKPEAECLEDMMTDSVSMIIATRAYTEDERMYMVDSLDVVPDYMIVARDAISVIVNPDASDSLFSMTDIRAILKGSFKKNLIPVFDGVKATSTVRFIIDSILHGDSITGKAMAARSSEGVIDYVSKNKDVIGFIGVSWIGNPEDSTGLSFLKKVRVASLESTDIPGAFVKAYQANIYIKRYPMVRDLVYMVKEKEKALGHRFADFMSGEIGQLIFRRAYLVPAQKNFGIRPVRVRE
jgi:phosphate transport system substrate-binding protein